MGLEFDETTLEVKVNNDVGDHLNTLRDGNPTSCSVAHIEVWSVFQRRKASRKLQRDRDLRPLFDNCPLIYALKRENGLWVSRKSVRELNKHIPSILEKISASVAGRYDTLAAVPSRHPLALMLAKRLSRQTGLPVHPPFFRKATFFEASRRADAILSNRALALQAGLSYQDETSLRNLIKEGMKQGAAPYSSKHVRTSLREFFDPLRLLPGATLPSPEQRVLIVDDLLATGETLLAASSLLDQNGRLPVEGAVTWFSQV